MLHPPYTLMVLSFVMAGAALAPSLSWPVLVATLAAYFLALGIGAHFLDQIPGMGSHYVRHWPTRALWIIGIAGVAAGLGIGVVGAVVLQEPVLLLLVIIQGICALGYPLAPLFRGTLHRESVFALSWGSLPAITSYYAQSGSFSIPILVLAAAFAAVAILEIRVSRASRAARVAESTRASGESGPPPGPPGSRRPDAILMALALGTVLFGVGLLLIRVAGAG
jgi:hypothetical protein